MLMFVFLFRGPIQRSSSVQHDWSSQDTSLGIESLAFHDHHLGRKGHSVMMKASRAGSSKPRQMSTMKPFANTKEKV